MDVKETFIHRWRTVFSQVEDLSSLQTIWNSRIQRGEARESHISRLYNGHGLTNKVKWWPDQEPRTPTATICSFRRPPRYCYRVGSTHREQTCYCRSYAAGKTAWVRISTMVENEVTHWNMELGWASLEGPVEFDMLTPTPPSNEGVHINWERRYRKRKLGWRSTIANERKDWNMTWLDKLNTGWSSTHRCLSIKWINLRMHQSTLYYAGIQT